MIGLLKMHAAGKTWGEICLQAIRVTFFLQYVVHDQGKDKGGMKERREVNFLVGGKKRGDIQKRGRDVLNFDHEGGILGTPFSIKRVYMDASHTSFTQSFSFNSLRLPSLS